MMTLAIAALIVAILFGFAGAALKSPLIRTLSITIDNWADSVHGQEPETRLD